MVDAVLICTKLAVPVSFSVYVSSVSIFVSKILFSAGEISEECFIISLSYSPKILKHHVWENFSRNVWSGLISNPSRSYLCPICFWCYCSWPKIELPICSWRLMKQLPSMFSYIAWMLHHHPCLIFPIVFEEKPRRLFPQTPEFSESSQFS